MTPLHAVTSKGPYGTEDFLRRKLQRWRIVEVLPGTLSRRACLVLREACATVPLRVAIVLFRTWVNGWCTARRFQIKDAACLFQCEGGSGQGCNDSIEHYAHCPVVRAFARDTLNMPGHTVGNLLGFLCLHANFDPQTRITQHLLLYAIYSATNKLRKVRQ